MMSDKIGPQHLRRKAMLYVRQSSPHQVKHNRESGALVRHQNIWDIWACFLTEALAHPG